MPNADVIVRDTACASLMCPDNASAFFNNAVLASYIKLSVRSRVPHGKVAKAMQQGSGAYSSCATRANQTSSFLINRSIPYVAFGANVKAIDK